MKAAAIPGFVAIAVSEAELGLHRKPRMLRRFCKGRYPVNLHSGKPILEFVELADGCAALGVPVVSHRETEEFLKRGEPILQFGKTDLARDLALLARYPNAASEWNRRNLETIGDYPRYLNLGRKTWNLILGAEEHQRQLRDLFRTHGQLFIKTVSKGYAQVHGSYEAFMAAIGDIARLSPESQDLLVSEVMDIRPIRAAVPEGVVMRGDEWRHHVYRRRLVSTTHAFDCDLRRTDDGGRAANVSKALAAIEELRATAFATTYVLDTCTLMDGSVAMVETNNFFASGIYEKTAIRAIAQAVAAAPDADQDSPRMAGGPRCRITRDGTSRRFQP